MSCLKRPSKDSSENRGGGKKQKDEEMTASVDLFSSLPYDCLLQIMKRLRRPDLCSVALTSRRLRRLLDTPEMQRRLTGGFTLRLERPTGADPFRTSAQERGSTYSYHCECDTSADGGGVMRCDSNCRMVHNSNPDTSGLDYGGLNGYVAYEVRLFRKQHCLRPPATASHPKHNYKYKCQTYEVNKDADAERLTTALFKESPSISRRDEGGGCEYQFFSPQMNLKTELQKTSMRCGAARRSPFVVVFKKIATFVNKYQIGELILRDITIDSALVALLCTTFDGTQQLRSVDFGRCAFKGDSDDVIKLHEWLAAVGCEKFDMISTPNPGGVRFPTQELLVALPKLRELRVDPDEMIISAAAVERVAELTHAGTMLIAPDDIVSVIKARCHVRLRGRHYYKMLPGGAEERGRERTAWMRAALGSEFEHSARFLPNWPHDTDLHLVHLPSGLHCCVTCIKDSVYVKYALELEKEEEEEDW